MKVASHHSKVSLFLFLFFNYTFNSSKTEQFQSRYSESANMILFIFTEEMWKHRLVGYHNPTAVSSASEGSHSPEKYIAMGHIKCEYCNDFFPHHRSLKRHMYAVHRDVLPKWRCAICGDEFDSRKLFLSII